MPPREAEIQRAALAARVRANVPAVAGDDPQVVGFFVEIIITFALGWLIQRLLSWFWPATAARRLEKALRRGCEQAAATPEARARGLTAEDLYLAYADRVRRAVHRTASQIDPAEVEAMRAALRATDS